MVNRPDDEVSAPVVDPQQVEVPAKAGTDHGSPSSVIVSTRTSRAWLRLLPALVVLVVILVFVFQNPKDVKVSLFTFSGALPLSVALLGAVILGVFIALALGSVRILQLRKQVHRKLKEYDGDDRRHS